MNTATMVPMTKERAGEILYESLKQGCINCGGVTTEEEVAIMMQFRDDFAMIGVSPMEIVDFIQFVKDDVNQTLNHE